MTGGWAGLAVFALVVLALDRAFLWLARRGHIYWRGMGGRDDSDPGGA